MPVVTSEIQKPGGAAASETRVIIELVGEGGRRVLGYVASGFVVEGSLLADVSTDGVWTVTLVANPLITPAGTMYRVSEFVDGVVLVQYITVPDDVGPYFVEDILEDGPPGPLPGSALAAHIAAATGAHAATAISVTPAATIESTDVGAALVEVAEDAATYTDAQILDAQLSGTSLRGAHDASTNLFPATGGSGGGGAVLKGDFWFISVAGTLGGTPVVAGDQVIALVNAPGQTAGNWQIVSHGLGYVAENQANKSTDVALGASDTAYPSQKAAKTYVDAHINDVAAAHAASAVGFTPVGTVAATDVQAAIAEVASDVAALAGADLVLRNETHLRRWRDARRNASVSQPVITVVGDSITAGAKAHDLPTAITTPAEMRTARYLGYAGILRDRFDRANGYGGEGFIFAVPYTIDSTYYEYRVANTGAGTPASGGPGTLGVGPFVGLTLTNGQQITFTTDQPCTQIDIVWGFATTPLTAAFTYTVDGGAPVTSSLQTSVANEIYVESITGLADTTHVIVINGPTTKRADICGLVCTRPDLPAAPVVNGIGQSGARVSSITGGNFTTPATAVAQLKKFKPTFRDTNTDLAIIMIGYNDAQSSDDVATFKATIQGTCDYIVSLGGCVLLVPDPLGNLSPTFLAFLEAYYVAMQEVSDATDHVAYTDLTPFWPDYATAVASGLIADTSVHPNSTGHRLIGEGLYRILSGAVA